MEISAWLFFSTWAITSLIFLKLGFNALDRTHLSDSVPAVVMFLFKQAFAIAVCHSSDYTFVHCKQVPNQEERYHQLITFPLLAPLLLTIIDPDGHLVFVIVLWGFACFFLIAKKPGLSDTVADGFGLGVDFIVKLTVLCPRGKTKFIPVLVLVVSCYTSDVWAAVTEERSPYEALPVTVQESKNSSFRNKKSGKSVPLADNEVGTTF